MFRATAAFGLVYKENLASKILRAPAAFGLVYKEKLEGPPPLI